jgi:hypothetical protein
VIGSEGSFCGFLFCDRSPKRSDVRGSDESVAGQGAPLFLTLLRVRWIMDTLLIVLLVLFVLGGGGYGYSRWR